MTDPALFAIAKRLDGEGASLEQILAELRKTSPSIIESMKVVRDLRQWPMDRVKLAVHNSETWRDVRDSNNQLHDDAERAAAEEFGSA
jgi:hypothetical protein